MPDHYHIIISPAPEQNSGQVLHQVNGVFARMFNMQNKQVGRVFHPFFYDHVVRNTEDYARIAHYIHNNPVKANFVDKPEEYLWSSARNRLIDDHSVFRVDDPPF